jgi:hypothetical protein
MARLVRSRVPTDDGEILRCMNFEVRRAIKRNLDELVSQRAVWQRAVDETEPDTDTGAIQDDIDVLDRSIAAHRRVLLSA